MFNEEMLSLYQNAINEIEDYFEYTYDSQEDKEYVMKVIDKLAKEINEI